MYFIQIYNQYSWIKRMIHVRLWIRICLLQLNYLFGVGIERKHIMGSRSEHRFPVRSRVPPKHINSREIGKTCQQKWNFQHQNHDDYDFLITYENETSLTTRLIILFFLNNWNINLTPRETWHGNRRRWINFRPQMFKLRIYKVVSSIISYWLSVRVWF